MSEIVKQQMTKGLVTVRWDAGMQEAADLMEERRIRHLPVVDETGVVVGILSDRDVNRAMSPAKRAFLPDSEVCDYMNWPVITVRETMPLKDAAQGMIDEKISAFLVTSSSNAIVGILTSEDLLKVLVAHLSEPKLFARVGYSPVIGELLREAESAGL